MNSDGSCPAWPICELLIAWRGRGQGWGCFEGVRYGWALSITLMKRRINLESCWSIVESPPAEDPRWSRVQLVSLLVEGLQRRYDRLYCWFPIRIPRADISRFPLVCGVMILDFIVWMLRGRKKERITDVLGGAIDRFLVIEHDSAAEIEKEAQCDWVPISSQRPRGDSAYAPGSVGHWRQAWFYIIKKSHTVKIDFISKANSLLDLILDFEKCKAYSLSQVCSLHFRVAALVLNRRGWEARNQQALRCCCALR